jgi:hypothetical protein
MDQGMAGDGVGEGDEVWGRPVERGRSVARRNVVVSIIWM